MKKGQRIRIKASIPADGQGHIQERIGEEHTIKAVFREDGEETGEIGIQDDDGFQIILNREEYELVD